MARFIKHASKTLGLPPGTMVHVGKKKTERVHVKMISYDETSFEERDLASLEECASVKDRPKITWIDVVGVHDVQVVENIGKRFDLHPLVLEDIVHTDQRPKLEEFDEYLFVVTKMLTYDEAREEIETEQIGLVLGSNFILSFQEREGDVFNSVRGRIGRGVGRIKRMGPDYLAYALMDAVVDHYFVVLEKLGDKIQSLEQVVVEHPSPETVGLIHRLKRDLIFMRKSVWPLREVVGAMEKGESDLIQDKTSLFFRDLYDHAIQVIDTVETYRDMVSGMLDVYLSMVSYRMNEVVKVLTIIATIFIPLTFIVGIYGMNFKHMPELEWDWSYPFVWFIMIVVAISMVLVFRKKKWL